MIVDTSALVASLRSEPGFEELDQAMFRAPVLRMAAPSVVELTAVLTRHHGRENFRRTVHLLDSWGVIIEDFTGEQARIASQAYADYGRGSGHRAGLNMGDCYAYALAIAKDEPLLFVGDDFAATDVRPAL